jgi:hypothetical protein
MNNKSQYKTDDFPPFEVPNLKNKKTADKNNILLICNFLKFLSESYVPHVIKIAWLCLSQNVMDAN